jgi:ABC-type Fe3+ transport system permease subunit
MNWTLLQNSLLVSGLATLLACGLGFAAALWAAGLPKHWSNRLLGLGALGLALPPFLVANCWLDLLGNQSPLYRWLPLNIYSLWGAAFLLALMLWPITLFAVSGAWSRLEPSQLESEPALTGGWLIRALLFPAARSALTSAAMLTFVLALNNFAIPAILQVKVFPAELWVLFNTTFDAAGALRLSWPLLVGPLLLLICLSRREIAWPRFEGAVAPALFRRQLGSVWFRVCAALTIALCALSVGMPLARLVSVGRTWSEMGGALRAGQQALWHSVLYAGLSATVIVGLALTAGVLSQRRRAGLRFLSTVLWMPFLVPGVLTGIALIRLFNHGWSAAFYASIGIVLLALTIRYLALGSSLVGHAFQSIDGDLRDAARLEGATRAQLLRYVYWPQVSPAAGAAWYIIFLLCLWDVESLLLVVPPGGETLALRVFNLLHYGHNAQVNALCLLLLALAASPLLLWTVVSGRRFFRVLRIPSGVKRLGLLAWATSLFVAGCAPHNSGEAPLNSKLFNAVRVIGSRGVGVGEFNKPRSVAVDRLDNVYAVDMTGRVQKFSSNGIFLLSWQMPQTELGKAKGMGRDLDGNIIVVEPHYQRVNHFSPEGRLLAQWGHKGKGPSELLMPRAVGMTSRGEIFLSEYGQVERVQKFALAGSGVASEPPHWVATFGRPGTEPGEFNRPEGLCVDSKDRLYVADSCNHRIQVFSSDGKFLRAYGKPGTGPGELSYPYDICVDGEGRQYVCEFGNSRIQVFDANDQPLEVIGGPGAEPGQFSNPWGVALDSAGNLYVADSQNHRVQKLIRRHG